MTYRVELVSKVEDDVELINVGLRPSFDLQVTNVLVSKNDLPSLCLICYIESDSYHFNTITSIWKNIVIVGAGHRLFTINLTTRKANYFDLDSYFIAIHVLEELLLITSGMHIHAIDASTQLVWSAKDVGIDGVIIDEVRNDSILGRGNIDPPDGWKPFMRDLITGRIVKYLLSSSY